MGDDRYILCLNEEEERKDEAAREAILEHLREELEGGAMSLVGNKGYARYLKVTKGLMRIDEDKVLAESRYDGKYVLRTNTDLAASEVARTYKSLWRVERAFRETKSTLEVRTDLQGTAHQASLAAGVRPPSPVAMTSRHDL